MNNIVNKLTPAQLSTHNISPEDVETIGTWYGDFVSKWCAENGIEGGGVNVVTRLDLINEAPTFLTTVFQNMEKLVEMSNTYDACVQVKADVEKEG